MEFAEKQLIIMQPEEVQTSRTWLKVTQDKRHDFPSNKCCFSCRSSIHLANKLTVAKKKKKTTTKNKNKKQKIRKRGKERNFANIYK